MFKIIIYNITGEIDISQKNYKKYSIFIKNMLKYNFKNICNEDSNLYLKDGTYKIFFNSKYFKKEENELLKTFLKYVNGKKYNNSFVEKLDERIRKIKESKE